MSGRGRGIPADEGRRRTERYDIIGRRKFCPDPPVTPKSPFFPRDEWFMRLALREAERALEHDDVPVGAVAVFDGEVVGAGHNERELRQDPTAHAEMIALREAAAHLGSWRGPRGGGFVGRPARAACAGGGLPG